MKPTKMIKKLCAVMLLTSFLLACSDDSVERNPYLQETKFSFQINLNLPLYSSLATPGNSIYIGNDGVGIKGVFVTNTGSSYIAFEASCPNHTPSSCSTMKIEGGTSCKCDCDEYEYSLFTGEFLGESPDGQRKHAMLNYRTTASGSSVIVSN